MTTRTSAIARKRQVEFDARAAARPRTDREAVVAGIQQVEAAAHVGQARAGRESVARSAAVVVDRAAQALAVDADGRLDAAAPALQAVLERILGQRLQQQARDARA